MPRPRSPFAPLAGPSLLALAFALAGCITSVTLGSDRAPDAGSDAGDGADPDAPSDAPSDVGSEVIEAGDDAVSDAPGEAAPDADADAPEAEAACDASPSPADVYVDARATGPSNGTAACPFHTVREATALPTPSAARVIHVAGGATAVKYRESGPIVLGPNLVLRGEGGVAELICASGCAFPDGTVILDGGGIVENFTITTETAGPPYGVKVTAKLAAVAPTIRNVKVTLAKIYGILADESVDVGPDVVVTYAGASGLYHGGPPTSVLCIQGSGNVFDANKAHGIFDNSAKLVLTSASASNNVGDGLHLEGYPTSAHSVSGLIAKGNGGDGVRAMGTFASVLLADSTLTGNGGFAVRFRYQWVTGSQQNTLSASNTTLGGAVGANARGAICLEQAPPTIGFAGDRWSGCPPLQRTIVGCDDAPPATYQDLWIAPFGATTSPTVTGCTIGP